MMTVNEVVEIRGLSITRPDGGSLLNDVSLHFGPAELVLLVGPSGSGKSTLLSLLAGLLETGPGAFAVSGQLECGAHTLDLARTAPDVGGIVFQSHALFDDLNAIENLLIASDHADAANAHGLDVEIEDLLDGIDPQQLVTSCSGGQRQRLAIARTVLANRPVLLFDEPNAGLDIVTSRKLVEVIRKLCRSVGKPALVAVHHFQELLPLADRVFVLDPRSRTLVETPAQVEAVEAALERASNGSPAEPAATGSAHDIVSRWRFGGVRRKSGFWFLRYLIGYLWLLCASPVIVVYMAAGACIIGFVTIWFGFNYYSFAGHLKSLLHDDTLVGLGMVQCRIAIPLISNILFVARNSAVIAADVGNRTMSFQFQAMTNLNVPGRFYVFSSMLLSMVVGAVALLLLSILLGAWAAQETWHLQFPTQYRAYWRGMFFRNVLDAQGWPVPAMAWVIVKTVLSAALATASSILLALGRKSSSHAVNAAVANAIVVGVLLTLCVHAFISILTS